VSNRRLLTLVAALVFSIALTLGIHNAAIGDSNPYDCDPETQTNCDCCETEYVLGALQWNYEENYFECHCQGCAAGPGYTQIHSKSVQLPAFLRLAAAIMGGR